MVQLIALIIFILSFLGLCFMLYKKIPVLAQLPQNGHHGLKKSELILKIEKKLKDFHFDFFKKQIFLHRALSKCRILILKIEKKIDVLLHGIRKKVQELDQQNEKK